MSVKIKIKVFWVTASHGCVGSCCPQSRGRIFLWNAGLHQHTSIQLLNYTVS